MRRMNRLWLGLGVSAAVIGVVAGVTLGVTTLLGVTFEESEPKPVEGVQRGNAGANEPAENDNVETERYPGLSFCVQAIGIDPSVEAVAKARIETALLEVMQHRYWKLLKRDSVPPQVDIGCPSQPLVSRPGVRWVASLHYAEGDFNQYNVTEPSFYWTFVFIMPIEQINQVLGGLTPRIAPQEYAAEGDLLKLESTAIYVAPEELEDPSFLARRLMIAVGLESAYPEPASPVPTTR